MPVLSVSVPSNKRATLSAAALLHGIEADFVESEDGVSYIDLIGREDKINIVASPSYVAVIEQNDSVPHDEPVYTLIGRHFQ